MKKTSFFTVMLIIACAFCLLSCQTKQQKSEGIPTENIPQEDECTSQETPEYVPFCKNGLYGVKNDHDDIIVSADYDEIEINKNIIVAKKGNKTYLYDNNKSAFNKPIDNFSIEDKFITATSGQYSMLYFYKTKQSIENIISGSVNDDCFLLTLEDDTFTFCTEDGTILSSNLRRPKCLQKKIDGYVLQKYLVFDEEDCDDKLFFTPSGEFKYRITLTMWQRIAIDYLKRNQDDDNEFKVTFDYRINLDRCIQDYLDNKPLDHYPEE